MSVRRLAEDRVQPHGFAFNRQFGAEAKVWIKKYPAGREQSAVIPLLMLAQDQQGWVTRAAIEAVAAMLSMPLIRVLEVATFYTQFQLQPVGTKAHLQVCGTTPCMLRGAEDLKKVCQNRIHHEPHHLSADGHRPNRSSFAECLTQLRDFILQRAAERREIGTVHHEIPAGLGPSDFLFES